MWRVISTSFNSEKANLYVQEQNDLHTNETIEVLERRRDIPTDYWWLRAGIICIILICVLHSIFYYSRMYNDVTLACNNKMPWYLQCALVLLGCSREPSLYLE